jgi:membrane protease YdiL (CAAX protease family)
MNGGIPARPALAIVLLMVLFVVTEGVSEGVAMAADPDRGWPYALVKLAVCALAVFVLVPVLLRLPAGDSSLRSFPADVGLDRFRPLGRNLLLLVAIYATFAASQTAGQWLHHLASGSRFAIDPGRHDLLGGRTLASGIVEEIVMRGVMLTYLLTRLSRRGAVLVSAAVFGGIHLLNLLNPASSPVWVLAQAVWAFAFGVMYAEVFIGTGALVLPILIHVLVNGTAGVWFGGFEGQGLASALYGLPFFGVIPALLGVLWARLLVGGGGAPGRPGSDRPSPGEAPGSGRWDESVA